MGFGFFCVTFRPRLRFPPVQVGGEPVSGAHAPDDANTVSDLPHAGVMTLTDIRTLKVHEYEQQHQWGAQAPGGGNDTRAGYR